MFIKHVSFGKQPMRFKAKPYLSIDDWYIQISWQSKNDASHPRVDCFISSVRSSSGYHGLLQATFSNFSNSSDSKVKVKVNGPNMCYIFEKHGIQGYRIWHSRVSNVKYTNTRLHKYTNTKCLKDPTCAIFFKSMGLKDIKYDIPVSYMVCIKCEIHKNTYMQINKNKVVRRPNISNIHFRVLWR